MYAANILALQELIEKEDNNELSEADISRMKYFESTNDLPLDIKRKSWFNIFTTDISNIKALECVYPILRKEYIINIKHYK